MKFLPSVVLLFFFFGANAQEEKKEKPLYFKLELGMPFVGNPDREDSGGEDEYWFLPAGLDVKAGFGYQYKKILAVGAVTGIGTRFDHALVTAPILADLTLSPKLGDDIYLYANFGIGKSFAIGRGNLSGLYRRIGIGLGDGDDFFAYVEASQHDFPLHDLKQITSISLCVAFKL